MTTLYMAYQSYSIRKPKPAKSYEGSKYLNESNNKKPDGYKF